MDFEPQCRLIPADVAKLAADGYLDLAEAGSRELGYRNLLEFWDAEFPMRVVKRPMSIERRGPQREPGDIRKRA